MSNYLQHFYSLQCDYWDLLPYSWMKIHMFNTYECQKTHIKNPFDPILGFGLVKDFWKWFFFCH
jgi:hypothetical protein